MDKIKFLEQINALHPYLEVIEIRSYKYVKVKNEFGECIVQLYSLLEGSKPTIATAIDKTKYFTNQLKKYQPDLILLDEYRGSFNKVKVRTKYGDCFCTATSLLRGKPLSIDVAIDKNNYFKNLAIEIHGDRYDYSKVNYISGREKVTLICKKHGEFQQDAHTHLKGKGCIKCGFESHSGGWYNNHRNFNKLSNMYILNFKNNEEDFMKFGITVNLTKRINSLLIASKGTYKINIVKVVSGTVEYCSKLESRYRRRIDSLSTKYLKYEPRIDFQGKHECFQILGK